MSNNATVAFNHTDPLVLQRRDQRQRAVDQDWEAASLDLSGTSAYSGPTTISAGTVELDGNGDNLPTATALTIASSGVFDLAGSPADGGQPERLGRGDHHEQLLRRNPDVDGGYVLRLDDVRREHHRQQCVGAFRQRRS